MKLKTEKKKREDERRKEKPREKKEFFFLNTKPRMKNKIPIHEQKRRVSIMGEGREFQRMKENS